MMRKCKIKRTCGILTMKPITIRVETKIGSWSIMKQLELMSPLQIIQRLSSKKNIYGFN